MTDTRTQTHFTDTVDRVTELVQSGTATSAGEVAEAAGRGSQLKIILLAAALTTTPLSGLPGMATAAGLTIAYSALQALRGRTTVKLPDFLARQSVSNKSLLQAVSILRKVSAFLDNNTRRRFKLLVSGPARVMLYCFFILSGLLMPVLEFIPFSSSLMGGVIALFAVAASSRDGLWAATALILLSLMVTTIVWVFW